MLMNDLTNAKGSLTIQLIGPDGNVKQEVEHDNLVVNTGLAYLISRAVGAAKSVMSHMAIGAGTADPTGGDTALGSELGRVTLDSTTVSGTNDEKVVYAATFNPGTGTGAVTEAGVFNAATNGDMLCRTEFPVVNKQAGDTLAITWTITLSAN